MIALTFFVSVTLRIILVLLQLFLINLQNILKFNILATKSVGKKGASSGFNSRVKVVVLLTFMTCVEKLIGN